VGVSRGRVRDCRTCRDVGRERCIYFACRDAVAVGLCKYGDIDRPVPCRTCRWRNPNTGTAATGFQLCRSCLQADFVAWVRGKNVCTEPPYVPQEQP
jgi:hypothetical protein